MKLVMIAGMCMGSGMLVAQGSHGWGNPFKYFCGEPCGMELRRTFQFTIPQFPEDVMIHSITPLGITAYDSLGAVVAQGNTHTYYPIELPSSIQNSLPQGASPCILDYPIPSNMAATGGVSSTCTFPYFFPQGTSHRFFLMEVLMEFGCNTIPSTYWTSPVGGQQLPAGTYIMEWAISGEKFDRYGRSLGNFQYTEVTESYCSEKYGHYTSTNPRNGNSNTSISNVNALQVYPSQTDNRITCSIEVPDTESSDLTIKDIMGRTVQNIWIAKKIEAGNTKESVEVSMLSNGVYFIEYRTENSLSTQKFIKY